MNPKITVMTFNIWGNEYLSERSSNIKKVLEIYQPDLLLLQEVTPENLALVHQTLPDHNYIDNTKSNDNNVWMLESNIFWNNSIFEMIDSGYKSFQHHDYPRRGLFWVRLAFQNHPNSEFLVTTAHFPWVGCQEELLTGVNQRIQCANLVLSYLHSICKSQHEPIIFGGDLNDDFHPLRILTSDQSHEPISLQDVFTILDLPPQITHPIRPSDSREEMRPSRTIDYILISNKDSSSHSNEESYYFRPIAAFVKGVRGGWPPPSDHLPVISVLELRRVVN